MTMFSFGSIKYNAAFFGAISIVRKDSSLVDKMVSIQDTYPEQCIKEYEKKIKTFLGLNLASNTLVCAISDRYFDLQNIDFEDWIVEKMRGFPASDKFLNKFRIKPNAALLRNLHYRLFKYTGEMHMKKI